MKMAGVMKKTHLVNDAGEADTAVETVVGRETILGEMGDDMRMEDVEVAEDDGGEEEEAEVGEVEAPKLPQQFYEVEAIRSKRVHKGKVQYLIKWRHWPETTNTWEPLKNLETIPAAIAAFEKSLRKAGKKRKGKSGGSNSQLKKKKKQQRVTSTPLVEPNSGSVGEEEEYDPTLNELRGPVVNSNGAGGGIGSEGDDGLLKAKRKKVDKKRLRGAKRRKSGIVRRYIPVEPTSNNNNNQNTDQNQTPATDQNQTTASEQNQTPATDQNQTTATEQNQATDTDQNQATDTEQNQATDTDQDQTTVTEQNQTPDLPKKEEEVVIVRIIRPVGISTSMINNAQEVLVTFLVLRSDGVQVTVDNKFLRVYNPNLLLDFYEQNIKYKTEIEE